MKYIKWLNDNCQSLEDKNIIVTGATGGIGSNILRYLFELDANVILAIRNIAKGEKLLNDLKAEYPNMKVDILHLDVSLLSDIDNFVREVNTKYSKIDILINNAGVYHLPSRKTDEGIEIHQATNYVGPFYLTTQLLPILSKSPNPKVICVDSLSYYYVKPYVSDEEYQMMKNRTRKYAITKMRLTQLFIYLQKIIKNEYPNVQITLTHPGVTGTDIINYKNGGFSKTFNIIARPVVKIAFMSPLKAALNAIYAIGHDVSVGKMVGPRGLLQVWGYPRTYKIVSKALNEEYQELIYNETTELIKSVKKNLN